MSTKQMNAKVKHVYKTTAEWADDTTVITKGILCFETTTDGKTLSKIGDGTKPYSDLEYINAVTDGNGENIAENISGIKEDITNLQSTIGDIQSVLATVVEVSDEVV